MDGKGSDIEMISSNISGYDVVADLNYISNYTTWSSTFTQNELLVNLNNASSFNLLGCTISSGNIGVKLDLESTLPGKSSYTLYKTETENLSTVERSRS